MEFMCNEKVKRNARNSIKREYIVDSYVRFSRNSNYVKWLMMVAVKCQKVLLVASRTIMGVEKLNEKGRS
jgi:hypothetical protein